MNRTIPVITLFALLLTTGVSADGLRDPMRPAGASNAAPAAPRTLSVQSLKLEGVIAGDKRVAIVNGRTVRAGDTVAGARIVEVLGNGVRYERAGKIFTLTLPATPAGAVVRISRTEDK